MADSRERPACGVVSLIGKAAVLKIASRAQACVGSSPSHFATGTNFDRYYNPTNAYNRDGSSEQTSIMAP